MSLSELHIVIAILAIYRFDATFDIESALPDLSQNFETFILQNCKNTQAKPKPRKEYLYFSGSPVSVLNMASKR